MGTPGVVTVYVFEAAQAEFVLAAEAFTVDTFALHMVEEAFTACVVIRIAFFGKRLNGVMTFKHTAERKGRIFGSLIRMEKDILRFTPV